MCSDHLHDRVGPLELVIQRVKLVQRQFHINLLLLVLLIKQFHLEVDDALAI